MLLAWGRMARLSLFPSALADVAAGLVLGAAAWPSGAALLLVASAAVYHGGMLLNDWADREQDRAVGRDRPLAQGTVAPAAVLTVGLALVLAAPAIAFAIRSPAAPIYVSLALFVLIYDLGPRGPWQGPLLLAFCRGGNLLAGLLHGAQTAAPSELPPALLALPLLYVVYVFFVSRLGRLEDGEANEPVGQRPRYYLIGAALALLAAPWVAFALGKGPFSLHHAAAAALTIAGSVALVRRAFGTAAWSPPTILPAMGAALRRLLIVSAAAALLAPWPVGAVVAVAILLGYPASYALRGTFPPS